MKALWRRILAPGIDPTVVGDEELALRIKQHIDDLEAENERLLIAAGEIRAPHRVADAPIVSLALCDAARDCPACHAIHAAVESFLQATGGAT